MATGITSHFKISKGERSSPGNNVAKKTESHPICKQSANEDLDQLKQFDLDWEYGPCTGLSRLERWERAKMHGLNPPQCVKDIVLQNAHDKVYTLGVWSDYEL